MDETGPNPSPVPSSPPPPFPLSGNRLKVEEGGGEGRKEQDHKQHRASDAGEWCKRDCPHLSHMKHLPSHEIYPQDCIPTHGGTRALWVCVCVIPPHFPPSSRTLSHCMTRHMTLLRRPMSASLTRGPSAAWGLRAQCDGHQQSLAWHRTLVDWQL